MKRAPTCQCRVCDRPLSNHELYLRADTCESCDRDWVAHIDTAAEDAALTHALGGLLPVVH